jgi:hypothetical protein
MPRQPATRRALGSSVLLKSHAQSALVATKSDEKPLKGHKHSYLLPRHVQIPA